MIRWILPILVLTHLAVASEADVSFQAGIDAYKQRDYDKARASFEAILAGGFESADLYFNLGNTAYKQKQYGYAVYYYRKALRLEPSHEDAQSNLGLTSAHVVDQINSAPDFFLFALAKTWFYSPTRSSLFVLVLIVWFIFWTALAFHVRQQVPAWVRWSSGSLAVMMVVVLLLRITLETNREQGIILVGSTDVKSEPLEKASTLFILHAGTEVHIETHEDDWLEIRLADGKTGWLRSKVLGIL